MKDRVKQKELFVYWKLGIHNTKGYFTKLHPPHHHKEILATYLYMANTILKLNHMVLQGRENSVLELNQ